MNPGLSTLTLLGIAVIVGLYAGKGSQRLRLPSIMGYMLLGVAMGVSGLDWLTGPLLEDLGFITEIALGFVAFSIGSELSMTALKREGRGIAIVIFAESFAAFLVVFGAVYLLTGDMPLSLIFGAVAPASAPAGTVAVIQEYRASGSLTKALYAVVGFDDGLAIVIFGFADAVARSILEQESTGVSRDFLPLVWAPMQEILLSLVIGVVIGFLFCQIIRTLKSPSETLMAVTGAVLVATGLSETFNLSLILTNMVVGFVLANTRREDVINRVMAPVLQVMPLLFVLFFCLAGAHLDARALPSLGVLGIVYVAGRTGGLMGGAWLGSVIGRLGEKIRKYLGLGILSQAGVAIGLSLIAKQQFDQIGTEHSMAIGATVITSVMATSIIFEIVGPITTKIALVKAGEIPPAQAGDGKGTAV
jgi:Kef-type K+ transport system membrane component KefB